MANAPPLSNPASLGSQGAIPLATPSTASLLGLGARPVRVELGSEAIFEEKRPFRTLRVSRLLGLEGAKGTRLEIEAPFFHLTTTVIVPTEERAAPLFYRREATVGALRLDNVVFVAGSGDRLEVTRLLDKWREGAPFFLGTPHWISDVAASSSGTRVGTTKVDLLPEFAALLWTAPVRGNAKERLALFLSARDAFLAHERLDLLTDAWFGRAVTLRARRELFP